MSKSANFNDFQKWTESFYSKVNFDLSRTKTWCTVYINRFDNKKGVQVNWLSYRLSFNWTDVNVWVNDINNNVLWILKMTN